VKLSKLCVYFDTDAARLEPSGGSWEKLGREGWDDMLLPANHAAGGGPMEPHPHARLASSVSQMLGPPATGAAAGAAAPAQQEPPGVPPPAGASAAAAAPGTSEPPPPGSPKTSDGAPQLPGAAPPPADGARHQFLLCPVDGTMRYTRRTAAARLLESDAAQEMDLKLHSISIRLHRLQYLSTQKLLEEFDRYTAGAPHRHLRPGCRPSNGG
jgi:hypothetical protein